MSISSISFSPLTAADYSSQQKTAVARRKDFSQLAQSLQTGNLKGAQQAYASLQLLQPNQSTSGAPAANQTGAQASSAPATLSNDFAALGKALQSGDISTAQQAFSTLQNDLSAASENSNSSGQVRGHHGHHAHGASGTQNASGSQDSTPIAWPIVSAAATTGASATTNGAAANSTINLFA